MFWPFRRKTSAAPAPERVEPQLGAAPDVQNAATITSSTGRWEDLFGPQIARAMSPELAMAHGAVWRCVSIISGVGAAVPLHTFRRAENGGAELAEGHAASSLLSIRPNERMSRTMFWRRMKSQMLLRGNAYAWIERKLNGQPIALWPVPYERVRVDLMSAGWARYHMRLDDMTMVVAHHDDVLHIPGSVVPEWDGLRFKTPMQAMASSVGIGLSADKYAQAYFDNDATPPSYITYPGKFQGGPEQSKEIREYWLRTFGGLNRFTGPAVLDQGGKVEQLTLSAEDAQLLETRRFSVEDIGRIFGVPRFLLGLDETSWGSGIEALGIGFVQYTMEPHFTAIEDEVNWKLFGTSKHYCAFDREALIRGDIKARADADRQALGGSAGPGWATPNEIRRRRNMPPNPASTADELVGWTAGQQAPKPKEPPK